VKLSCGLITYLCGRRCADGFARIVT
jgi:hypothetical protein